MLISFITLQPLETWSVMDPHSVYEIISGQNTITAALPLRQNTVKLITLISPKYRWKDLLKQKHGAFVSTDAFSRLCEVSPLNMIKNISLTHFPLSTISEYTSFSSNSALPLLHSPFPLSFFCKLDLLSTSLFCRSILLPHHERKVQYRDHNEIFSCYNKKYFCDYPMQTYHVFLSWYTLAFLVMIYHSTYYNAKCFTS